MQPIRLVSILLLTACLACGGSGSSPTDSGDPGTTDPSQYAIQFASFTLTGNSGVETSWDPDLGLIYLGADEEAQPLGTVTIKIGSMSTGTNGARTATVLTALVSASRVRVGTAEELGAVLYELEPLSFSQVTGIRVGDGFIEGTLMVSLRQISPAPPEGQFPALATLTGTFRAVNN